MNENLEYMQYLIKSYEKTRDNAMIDKHKDGILGAFYAGIYHAYNEILNDLYQVYGGDGNE